MNIPDPIGIGIALLMLVLMFLYLKREYGTIGGSFIFSGFVLAGIGLYIVISIWGSQGILIAFGVVFVIFALLYPFLFGRS